MGRWLIQVVTSQGLKRNKSQGSNRGWELAGTWPWEE